MNEFTVKKLAEVQAFVTIGQAIIVKSGDGFAPAAPKVITLLESIADVDLTAAVTRDYPDHQELFITKVDKTTVKLGSMMELYVGDEWDNPVEVLEWSSFYAGAGAAHAGLTARATEGVDRQLSLILHGLEQTFRDLLDEVIDNLKATV